MRLGAFHCIVERRLRSSCCCLVLLGRALNSGMQPEGISAESALAPVPAGGEAAAAGVAEPRRQPGGVPRRLPRAVHGRRARRERQGAARLVRCVAVTLRGKARAGARGCFSAHTPGCLCARSASPASPRARAGALQGSSVTSYYAKEGLSCLVWCAELCEVVEVSRRGSTCRGTHLQGCWPVVAVLCALTSGSLPQHAVLLHGLYNVVAVACKQDMRSLRA